MKITNLLLALLSTFLVNAQNTKEIQKFSILDVSSNVSVIIIQANEYKLEYKMLKGEEEGFIVKQSGENLKLTTKSSGMWSGNNVKVKVILYTPSIESIDASAGSSVVTQDNFDSDEMIVSASSGAAMDLDIKANNLRAEVSSGGSIEIKGSSKKTMVEASSGGSFKGFDLKSGSVSAEASSGGSIKVWCNDALTAEATSGGSINYKGEPSNTNVDAGFSGMIKKVD